MKKLTLAVLLLLSLIAPQVEAQNAVGACPFGAASLVSSYQEMITVSTAALPFTAATYKPTNGRPAAVCATVVVNTNSISWWSTGATPTSSSGIISTSGNSFSVGAADLPKFLMIRAGASDSAVAVIYLTLAQ